jgi:hypothetical protein
MTPTGTPLLSWDWLSHSGDESEPVLLLSARPILDRGRSQIDIAVCYADPAKARTELGWEATRGLAEMCADAWRWQSNNPQGYDVCL